MKERTERWLEVRLGDVRVGFELSSMLWLLFNNIDVPASVSFHRDIKYYRYIYINYNHYFTNTITNNYLTV